MHFLSNKIKICRPSKKFTCKRSNHRTVILYSGKKIREKLCFFIDLTEAWCNESSNEIFYNLNGFSKLEMSILYIKEYLNYKIMKKKQQNSKTYYNKKTTKSCY